MAQPTPAPSLDLIQRHSDAVNTSFGMLAGMQLDLFTPLREDPLTCEQIAFFSTLGRYETNAGMGQIFDG